MRPIQPGPDRQPGTDENEEKDFPVFAPLESHRTRSGHFHVQPEGRRRSTTTTRSTSARHYELGRKVLIVDFDPRDFLPACINAHELDSTIYDLPSSPAVRTSARNIHETTVEWTGHRPDRLVRRRESSSSTQVACEQALKRVLRPVLDEYDVILVDCQPSLDC